jgi:hypothetical protein
MNDQNSIPQFTAEAETCRHMFQSDSTSYLIKLEHLYSIEIRLVRIEYNRVYRDTSIEYHERWTQLYDIRLEEDLNRRLRQVISELLYDRIQISGRGCTYKKDGRDLDRVNSRTLMFQKAISIIRKENPGTTEEQAIQKLKDERGFTRTNEAAQRF